MQRHRLIAAFLACLAVLLPACTTLNALIGNQVSFTAPQLQAQLDRRFPRDYDKLGGLVTLIGRRRRGSSSLDNAAG